jgi:hypothetical protein
VTTIEPLPGFDWRKVTWGRPDSPRSALCSYCSQALGSDDVPLILFTTAGYAAQFCDACQRQWFGSKHYDTGEDRQADE